MGFGQCPAPVLGHQLVLVREPSQCFLADGDPGPEHRRVVEPGIPQRILEVLAPVVQRLGHRELLVELRDGADARRVAQAQHARPGIQPAGSGGCGPGALQLAVTRLDRVVDQFQAYPVRPPALPQGDQADPDPVPLHRLAAGSEVAAVDQPRGHLFGRQRRVAHVFQTAAVQVQAEASQFRQQLLVAEAHSI